MLSREPYTPPEWAAGIEMVPKARVVLGMFPTPIHRWDLPGVPEGTEVYIKVPPCPLTPSPPKP